VLPPKTNAILRMLMSHTGCKRDYWLEAEAAFAFQLSFTASK
jgi:hypothetical protein